MTWENSVNKQQQRAILGPNPNGCVVAGPGTGKTRTLLGKAMQLVEDEEVLADRLCIVNFTNAGVHDLRRKVDNDEIYRAIERENIRTFHSLALKALRRVEAASVPRPLVILDDWEERMFVDEFTKSKLKLPDIRKARKIRADYDARWCLAREEIDDWLSEGSRREFESLYASLKDILGLTTRGELTFLWWRYLRSHSELGADALGIDADYMLADEYQDLNECEHDILKVLSENGVNVFAVGDPNQSIYESLRHAHPQFCWEFSDRIVPADMSVLTRSYRCSRAVLEFGSALLGAADGVPDPTLAERKGEARILSFPTDTGEVSGVARLAQALLNEDSQRRILIAVPSRRAAATFYDGLQELAVPSENRAIRGDPLDDECRLARAYGRLLKEPNNSVAAATAIVLNCAPTTRRTRSRELLELGYERGERIATLLSSEFVPKGPLGKGITAARMDLRTLRKAENLAETLAELTGCVGSDTDTDLEEDPAAEDPPGIEPGRVTVMTVHSCKGLEADVTILPSVEGGEYERNLVGALKEERRRLLYVGITRAVEKVYLTFARQRFGPGRYSDPTGGSPRKAASTFIDDICDRLRIQPESGGEYLRGLLGS